MSSSRPTDFCTSLQKGVWKMRNLKSSRVKGCWMPAGRQSGAVSLPRAAGPCGRPGGSAHPAAAGSPPSCGTRRSSGPAPAGSTGWTGARPPPGTRRPGQACRSRRRAPCGSPAGLGGTGESRVSGSQHPWVLPVTVTPAPRWPQHLHRPPRVPRVAQPARTLRCPALGIPWHCHPPSPGVSAAAPTSLQHQGGVGSHQHGDGAGTSRGPRVPRGVDGDVPAHHHGVAAWGRTEGPVGTSACSSLHPAALAPPQHPDPCTMVEEGR